MKKILFSLILCGIIAASVFPGGAGQSSKPASASTTVNVNATGFPIVNTPITLKILGSKNAMHGEWDKMLLFTEYEKRTNIHLDIETAPQTSFAEKLNLVFASNDLPDMLVRCGISNSNALKWAATGSLVPLEGLINQYGYNLKNLFAQYPDVEKSITTPEKHIYTLPTVVLDKSALTVKYWINKNFMGKVNAGVPQTTDEFYQYLQKIRDTDVRGNGKMDAIPFSAMDATTMIRIVGGSWGLDRQFGYNINLDNNKVNIWNTNDMFKEELMFLNKLYTEKLIDPDVFTNDTARHNTKRQEGMFGIFLEQTINDSDGAIYQGMAPLKGPHGDRMQFLNPMARDPGAFEITNKNKYPEASIRWVDYFYGDEGAYFMRYGVEGQTCVKKPDGTYEYTDALLKDPRGLSTAIGQFTIWPGANAPHIITSSNSTAVTAPCVREAEKLIDPYLPKYSYSAPMFSEADATRADELLFDINKYFDESTAKFIVGDWGFDKWNEYKTTMEKMGLLQLQDLYQKAYDTIYR